MTPCYNCNRLVPASTPICPGCQALLEVNGYRLIGILGQGGGGAVYQARVLPAAVARAGIPAGRTVAFKQNLDAVSLHQLQREFAVLRTLLHPNLPRYYECFETGGHGYLIMEFIPGQNLAEVLDRHPDGLPEPQVLGYAVQLCDVLGYLHGQQPPILHRDIKPANIRLTPDGLIKLVDFGLLKQGTGQTRLSIMGLGTAEYAPLEQYGRGGGGTDPRSDLYSLAATLYHLLTGQPPDDAITRVTSASDPLRSPLEYRPALAPQVAEALVRALAIRPEGRFADVQQFRTALLGPAWSRAMPPAPLPFAPTPAASRSAAPATVLLPLGDPEMRPIMELATPVESVAFSRDGAAFAAGGADGAIRVWNRKDGTLLRTLVTRGGPVYSLTFSPDSSLLAAGAWGTQGTLWLWRIADGALERTMIGYNGQVEDLAFAPDGRTLASVDADGAVRLWAVPDGALRARLIAHEAGSYHSVLSLAWAPDGQVLAVGGWTVQIWSVLSDATAGVQPTLLQILPEAQSYARSLAFSPDGQILAEGGGDKLIRLWRTGDWTLLRTLAGHTSFVNSLAFTPDGRTLASASYDRTARLWRVEDGTLIGTLADHRDAVTSVAFAADGHLLASCSWDKTIRLRGVP